MLGAFVATSAEQAQQDKECIEGERWRRKHLATLLVFNLQPSPSFLYVSAGKVQLECNALRSSVFGSMLCGPPLREEPETGGQNGNSAKLETRRRDRTDSTCNLCNLHPEPCIAEGSHRGGYRELAILPQLPSTSHVSRGHPARFEQKIEKSRNINRVSGGGVGAKGMQVNLATDHHPETNTKCSQIALSVNCIALSSSIFGTKLFELSVSIKEVPDLRPGTRAKLVKKLFCGSLRKGSDPSSNPSTKSGVFLHTCRHAVLIGPFKSTALGTNRNERGW